MDTKQAQHTPGPWEHTAYSDGSHLVTGDHIEIASYKPGHPAVPDEHRAANARLIAAAPELLEALRVVSNCKGYADGMVPLGTHEMGIVRAAIAKAEGGAA